MVLNHTFNFSVVTSLNFAVAGRVSSRGADPFAADEAREFCDQDCLELGALVRGNDPGTAESRYPVRVKRSSHRIGRDVGNQDSFKPPGEWVPPGRCECDRSAGPVLERLLA